MLLDAVLPGSGDYDGAEVTDCHGEEDAVGGGLHPLPAEDDDADGVGDEGDESQERPYKTLYWNCEVQRAYKRKITLASM